MYKRGLLRDDGLLYELNSVATMVAMIESREQKIQREFTCQWLRSLASEVQIPQIQVPGGFAIPKTFSWETAVAMRALDSGFLPHHDFPCATGSPMRLHGYLLHLQ